MIYKPYSQTLLNCFFNDLGEIDRRMNSYLSIIAQRARLYLYQLYKPSCLYKPISLIIYLNLITYINTVNTAELYPFSDIIIPFMHSAYVSTEI